MVKSDELVSCLSRYGRSYIQDFVVRSRDVKDAATYLRVELSLELARAMSFRTMDLITFEREETFRDTSHG